MASRAMSSMASSRSTARSIAWRTLRSQQWRYRPVVEHHGVVADRACSRLATPKDRTFPMHRLCAAVQVRASADVLRRVLGHLDRAALGVGVLGTRSTWSLATNSVIL